MSLSGRGQLGLPMALFLLAAVYAAGAGAVLFAPEGRPVAAWWPAAGVAVALVALAPRRRWLLLAVAIAVVSGAANVTGGRPLDLSACFGVANAAEAVVAAAVLCRGRDRIPELESLEEFLRLVGAAILGAVTIATLAALSIWLLDGGSFVLSWRSVFPSHAASTLVIVPVAMTSRLRTGLRNSWEIPVQAVVLVAVTLIVFAPHQSLSLTFVPLPFLVWAALRFDLRTVTWELLGFSAATTFLSARGYGPFGFDYRRGQIDVFAMGALVQGYLLCAALMSLPLAIAMDQRRRALNAESDARRRIEAAEKLTSATLDTTPALIIVCDLYGEVVRVNGATTVLTGFAEDELVGKEVWDLPFASPGSTGYPTGLPPDAFSQVSRETDVVTSTGQRRRVLWNTGYVRDERDRPTYIVMTGTDLTGERMAAGLNRHLLEAAITTALIGIDPRGRITVFNAGAVNLLGYDAQDMVGTPFIDLLDPAQLAERFPGATPEEVFTHLVAGIEAGATAARDWTWLSSDGHAHTVSMTVSVAADTVAARLGYLCVGRNVTDARASQDMLVAALDKERLAVERMRQLDEAKNEFISTVSHELRTPVTSIVGYTELLEDGSVVDPAEEQRPLLESIGRNAQRLIALCNDLLTLGGLDSGATHWARETIDLASILPEAEDAVRPLTAGRDLTLSFSSEPDPILVIGDRVQLERVLVNLLGNAIKFTEDGGRVECRVERHDNEAWLCVSDTGIGIPTDEQAQLFQRFFRSSTAQQMAIQGTGLGLSIVAAIVAAHGGRIDVRSAHLEGTTFTVRLPVTRVRRG
jgi:PAS domain S-box-containing protein